MTVAISRISQIQLVMIPTTDRERAIAFYESLGFEKRNDIPWRDGHRWVELYPPGTPTGVALVPPGPGDPVPVRTGIILNTDDIDSMHAALRAKGVDLDSDVARVGAAIEIRIGAVKTSDPVPPMFWFRDPDGNSLLMVQPG